MFGYRGAAESVKPLTLFRTNKPYNTTLCRTTPSILGLCLGQMLKYTLQCFTQFKVLQRPANVPDLGLLNTV